MAQKMKVDDEVRLNILQALLKKSSTQPNLRKIKKNTKYHLATIKSSLDFLQDEGILTGYGPKIYFWKLGFKLEAVELLQMDFSNESKVQEYLEIVKNDPHTYYLASMMGSGNYNIISFQFHTDVESYHKNLQERYVKKMKGYYDLIKDRQTVYMTEPIFKRSSRTNSIIELLRERIGLD